MNKIKYDGQQWVGRLGDSEWLPILNPEIIEQIETKLQYDHPGNDDIYWPGTMEQVTALPYKEGYVLSLPSSEQPKRKETDDIRGYPEELSPYEEVVIINTKLEKENAALKAMIEKLLHIAERYETIPPYPGDQEIIDQAKTMIKNEIQG